MKSTPNFEVLIPLNSYTFCLFLAVHSILENLKVSKKLNSVSGCTLEVLLIFVVSCHDKSCIEMCHWDYFWKIGHRRFSRKRSFSGSYDIIISVYLTECQRKVFSTVFFFSLSRIVSKTFRTSCHCCEWFLKSYFEYKSLLDYHILTGIQWSSWIIHNFIHQVTVLQLKKSAIKWALCRITKIITKLAGRILWQLQKDSFAPCFIMLQREREIKLASNAWKSRSVRSGIWRWRSGCTRIQELAPELL